MQVFKIILGLIISAFVLLFVFSFVDDYIQLERETNSATALKNFVKTAGDVYLTGNAINFNGLKKTQSIPVLESSDPPGIFSSSGKVPLSFPLFFSYGEDLFIDRGVTDLKWWEFSYGMALPETLIVFNLLDDSAETKKLVTDLISSLPSSTFFEPKITFAYCSGVNLDPIACGSKRCERDGFLALPVTKGVSCSVQLPKNSRLITISHSCSPTFASKGMCIVPPVSGIGNFYLKGSQSPYIYKYYANTLDTGDLVAPIIAGDTRSVFGLYAENMFEYKNAEFRKELLTSSALLKQRALLLKTRITSPVECPGLFGDFENALEEVERILQNDEYHRTFGTVTTLVSALEKTSDAYTQLTKKGCDSL